MKKTLLAVLVPLVALSGAANAAEIYNKDGNKLDLYGKVDVRHLFRTVMTPVSVSVSKVKPRSLIN